MAHGFTVTARSAVGQVMTGYTGTVVFSSSDAQAGLPASYTFTAADQGVHTFTATLKTAAVTGQTLSVQDAANKLLLGSETNILVSNAAMSHFAIVVPSGIVSGKAFALKVVAQDDFGNPANDYRGTTHFANTAGSSGLPADYAFTSADNGQHTFTVTLTATGAQTISVVDVANALLKGGVTLTIGANGGGGGGGGGGGKH